MRKNNSAGRLLAAGIVALWLYLFLPVRFFDLPFSFGQVEERAFSAVWLFLTSMILIILFYKKKQIAFRFSICDILILMYVVYMLIRLYRNLLEHQHIITLFSLTLLYFIFRSLGIRHARLLIPVLAIALTVQVIQDYFLYHCNLLNAGSAISGTNQSIDIFFTGIYRNTGIWGGFVGIVLVGFYGLWLYSRRYKLVQAVLILFSLVLLVYSQSRAAWIGTMAGILLLTGIYLWEKYGSRLRKQIIIALLCSIPVAVFVGNMFFHLKPVSASGRIYIWEIASRMFADHLLFGMGIDRFQSQYMYYQAAYFLQKPDSPFAQIADDINVPFSEPLKVAVEQGVVGLTFVSGILLSVLIPVFISSRGRKYSPLEEAEGIPELQIQVSSKRQYNCRLTEGSIALTADHKFEMQTSFIYAAILITLLVFSCFSYPFTYIQFRFLLIVCVAVLSRLQTVCGFTVHCKKTGMWLLVPYTGIACIIAFTGIRYATTMQKLHRTISRSSIDYSGESVPPIPE